MDDETALLPKLELKEIVQIFIAFNAQLKTINNKKLEIVNLNKILLDKEEIIIKKDEIIELQQQQLEELKPTLWDIIVEWAKYAGIFALGFFLGNLGG